MPLNLVREYPKTPVGLLKLRQALDSRRCPALATRRRLFGLLPDAEKTTAAKLLYAYAQEKEAVLEQSALSEREKAAAKAAEVEAAEKQAQEAQQRADAAAERAAAAERESSELQNTMSDLEARLAEANAALQAMANAPTPATADVAAMQNAVAQLTGQLAETRAQADVSQAQALLSRQEEEELQHEADLADQAAAIEGGFLSRYKWHLMGVGGLALVGAGLWYYFKKYKPAQAAAAGGIAANPDDEEEVFFNGELVGYVGPSAIEGRWVARSVLFDRPTYSALKKARAENWLKELARG